MINLKCIQKGVEIQRKSEANEEIEADNCRNGISSWHSVFAFDIRKAENDRIEAI